MHHLHDGKIVVFAPYARDASSVVDILQRHEIEALAVSTLDDLVGQLGEELGAVVMTEEALVQANWSRLIDAVNAQPHWSSYPFILLIGQRRTAGLSQTVYSVLPSEITNVMVLERPMGAATLISAVRWALGGRARQFLTRDHLEELERNARQQNLMTRELAHRVKNTIAVLQSIVTQTMRPYSDVHEVRDLIIARFATLSRAHDLLLQANFTAADFRTLIEQTLSVHEGNFRIAGPTLQLSPQASLSFALVLHELATNSIKYGSLRSADGVVDIAWEITACEIPQLSLVWEESGGPKVVAPKVTGFGTKLIQSTLSGLGTVETNYAAKGFSLRFSAPLETVTQTEMSEFSY